MAQMRAPVLRLDLRTRTLLLFTLLFTIAGVALFIWTLGYGVEKAKSRLSAELRAIASTAAAGIDGDTHAALVASNVPTGRPLEDQRYRDLVSWLAKVKQSHGTLILNNGKVEPKIFLYTYTYAITDTAQLMFVGSAGAADAEPSGALFRQFYTKSIPEMFDGLKQPSVSVEKPVDDEWGDWVSGFAPIHNSKGEVVGAVGVDMRDRVIAAVQSEVMRQLLPIYGGGYIVVISLVLLLSHGISRSFSTLTRAAERVAEGDYSQDFSRGYGGMVQDETTTLAFAFQKMIDKVAAREQRLRQQVQDLKIEIDLSKQERQVAEITDTDYFRNLQVKARVLRSRASEHAAELEQSGGETPAVSTPTERITAVNDR
ncbi:MAG TPA: HAMP domain-containing protein [Roseiflexaceae bacterium]|nr:HAMP domain-containing protein [Roseiflexaceae bacterium]